MNTEDRKAHWENIFQTKDTSKVSWHQQVPETSLQLIAELNLSKSANIIEVGAGNSFLADFLIAENYKNITLLDISEKALSTIKNRLEKEADKIVFLLHDITTFSAKKEYDLWHDRAVFHFLTNKPDIENYIKNASNSLVSGAYLIISTFSDNGPDSCSDLKVRQYAETGLVNCFKTYFDKIKCFKENHTTPSNGIQNFTYCVFQRK